MGKNSFLNYYKMILEKVSFDKRLVQKEYWKAKQVLKETEIKELDIWLKENRLICPASHHQSDRARFTLTHFSSKTRTVRE